MALPPAEELRPEEHEQLAIIDNSLRCSCGFVVTGETYLTAIMDPEDFRIGKVKDSLDAKHLRLWQEV